MADEEALLVVIGVQEPAGDAVGVVADHFARLWLEDTDAVDLHLDLTWILGGPSLLKSVE